MCKLDLYKENDQGANNNAVENVKENTSISKSFIND